MRNSIHFDDMLQERGIRREWVERTIQIPDRVEDHGDGTRHFIKRIPEFGNRWLRVVVNVTLHPKKRVTAFFDRRLRRRPNEAAPQTFHA
uniref:DUF4258 domain-containing protein n=1 Tax=Candidatus Kentrum sp. UNK TaxID=2126344 RepID=A0A451B0D5_9GAMM|nr:MAG: protein of unknown function (DUF4258) [Candidatus Kentron sp. UNK]VFK71745.1 MAG: protein of unknown function (DUF4258) [Candidatus Kentron sp. UNK]